MATKITVKHIKTLIENLGEVKNLLGIHLALTGSKRGNRSSVNVLNKSGAVLVVACWEAFIEDLAKTAFEHMLTHARTADVFTMKVRVLASRDLQSSQDKSDIWKLAGNGWKKVLESHRDKVLSEYLGNFNTAKAAPIDDLFEDLIGLKSLSKYWHWQATSSSNACVRLDAFVTLRGDIAHRVKSNKTVMKDDVVNALKFIQNLAAITSNRVASYLYSKTKVRPWKFVSYGNRA